MILVQTRQINGKIEYLCPNDGWVKGYLGNETGYTRVYCEHCEEELDDDYYGLFAAENEDVVDSLD